MVLPYISRLVWYVSKYLINLYLYPKYLFKYILLFIHKYRYKHRYYYEFHFLMQIFSNETFCKRYLLRYITNCHLLNANSTLVCVSPPISQKLRWPWIDNAYFSTTISRPFRNRLRNYRERFIECR